ncbi:MAG: hypothetical protein ACU84Q_02225 [Gammaproteobacteria bacterium]
MAAITLAAGQFWGKVLSHFTPSLFTAYAVGITIAAVTMIAGILATSKFCNRWQQTMQCELCGQALKGVGSGFVNGNAPSRSELIIYVLTLSIPLLAWFVVTL